MIRFFPSSTARSFFRIVLGLVVGLAVAVAPVHAQIYVDKDATGANDGSSWTDAYTDLQTAIDNATSSDEIWIAEGVYRPSTSDPTVSFTLPGSKDGLEVYGGFEGTETSRSGRNPSNDPTVLSGDVDNDDATTSAGVTVSTDDINGDNSHGVLYLDGSSNDITTSTIIDGVTITAGQADGSRKLGGGIYCDGASDCSPTLQNLVFTGNLAATGGGALYDDGSEGGFFVGGNSSPEITNAVFVGNRSNGDGGAMYNDGGTRGSASPTITNCTFAHNEAAGVGAAILNYGRRGINCPPCGSSRPNIINSILWENAPGANSGNEIYNADNSSSATLAYSIIQGGSNGTNASTDFLDDGGADVSFENSTNLAQDPRFEYSARPAGTDGVFASIDDGLVVVSGSPALDAGDNDAVSATVDLTGESRTQNGTVDIGAYEGSLFDTERTVYVDASSPAEGADGTSWGTALPDLQDALAAATANDEIWIASGVYKPTSGTNPAVRFAFSGWKSGLKIYGGFTGGESSRSARDPVANKTVLSGDIDNNDNTNADGVTETAADISGTNSNTVFQVRDPAVTPSTVIDGVTITGGDGSTGGGLICRANDASNSCNPTVQNVIFAGNRADEGGAIFLSRGSGTLNFNVINGTFTGNAATNGGAIYSGSATPKIQSTLFVGNTAREDGAAIHSAGGRLNVRGATFTENVARRSGGAIYSNNADPSLINNSILWGNTADADGNGSGSGAEMYNKDVSPLVAHTLIEGGVNGSGVAGNTANVDDGGNLDADPQFVNATDPDGPDDTFGTSDDRLALVPGSPAIDRGRNDDAFANTDVTGAPRIQDDDGDGYANVNLGAYEITGPPRPTVATGSPSATSDSDASFSGAVNPNGPEATVSFHYRETGASSFTSVTANESPLTGTSDQSVSASASGLQADTEYEVKVAATNISGTTEGALKTFVTPPPNLSTTYTRRIVGEDGTGNDTGWRMLAQPAASRTRAALEDDVDFGRASSILYRWNGSNWTAQDQSSDPLPRGEGFILYFFDDAQSPLTSSGTAIDVDRGSEDPQADHTVSGLSDGDRFHLLGNPYDIAFDLGSLAAGDLPGAGFQATVQVWDPNASRYEPIIQGASDDDLPAWQGFFAQRSSVGAGQTSLTFAAAGRLSTDGALIGSESTSKVLASTETSTAKRESSDEAKSSPQTAEVALKLAVTSEGGAPVYTDQATYWVDSRAASGYDAFEARDLPPPTSSAYATATFPIDRSGDLAQRALAAAPYPTQTLINQSAPLSVRGLGVSGSATISWPDASTGVVPSDWNVRLEDTETGSAVDLRTSDYTFELSEGGSITSPSDARFRLVIQDSAVPVELAKFDGSATKQGGTPAVRLTWSTASEENNAGFEVQHQASASEQWRDVGFVDGAGTTSRPQSYRFTVNEKMRPGTHRFRLKQIDTDGSAHVHDPISVEVGMNAPVRLSAPAPNPVRHRATLSFAVKETQKTTVRLYNVLGQQVATLYRGTPTAEETQTIDLSTADLSSGIYIMRLQAGERTKTRRLTVVK